MLEVGKKAPAFTLLNQDGEKVMTVTSLHFLRRRPV